MTTSQRLASENYHHCTAVRINFIVIITVFPNIVITIKSQSQPLNYHHNDKKTLLFCSFVSLLYPPTGSSVIMKGW